MSGITWARVGFVVLASFFVQTCLLNQIVVFGAHPDVMVLLPVTAGTVAGPQRGAAVGFVAGLFADLVVQLPYGLSPLTFVLAGFGAGLLVTVPLGRDLPGTQFLSSVVLGTATAALYALIGAVVGQPGMLGVDTLRALVVVALGALVLGVPVRALLAWSFEHAGSSGPYSIPSGGSALG